MLATKSEAPDPPKLSQKHTFPAQNWQKSLSLEAISLSSSIMSVQLIIQ
jgi:hypothetical protein